MAKQSGLGDYLAVDDSSGTVRDISNDVTNATFNNGTALQEVTGIDKSAVERLQLLGDGTVSINGVFDAASNLSHDVFKVQTGTRTVTYAVGGNSGSNPKLEMEMLISAYNLDRAADGSLTWSAELSLESGTVPTWGTV
jgi:hypothetical protein|tara:strand:- start:247 stop:663 length:417 start_codon:yes stop_codon:yes gene_type:complete